MIRPRAPKASQTRYTIDSLSFAVPQLSNTPPIAYGSLQKVSSFLPELLIRPINRGEITQQKATHSSSFDACLLFADISGFTALAERLNLEGEEGAEILTLTLNRYFGSFIDLVYAYGGDVAKFAGDALLAVWPLQDQQYALPVATRTHACAQALQAFMENQPPTSHGIALKMKVAISRGPMHMACIGGLLARREMVLSSPALAELGHANDQAVAGDLIVCPSIRPLLKADVKPLDTPALENRALEQLTPSTLATGLEFIPAAIRQSLDADQDAWVNENRQVTVLFINLPGFSGDLAVQATQTCMIALQRSLYSVEGSVNKISVDDKGVSLMGCLGMPPFSHADDPQRAVQATMLIHTELRKL
ncbi:MAG: adenylate/guanylate cyclase domain-containing protein, partial [Limnobacter sp.]|nr:adenylate/guanylate cyclase domain-containing protein [Limnobacter sp.]